MARIAVVGSGYVGLTTGVCFAEMGHTVGGIDVNRAKVSRIQAGELPIYEPGLQELLHSNLSTGRLFFTDDYERGLAEAEFVFIAVGTPPSEDGASVEMKYVHTATREIGRTLKEPAVVVNKSTTPIGTGGRIARLLEEVNPVLAPWRVVSNPEFLREGNAVEDCLNPSRIVLGAEDRESAEAVADLYSQLRCSIIISDLNTAEMVKYASNAFLATRISFINEVARICDALGADVTVVAEGMGLDPRIGKEHLRAGLGYGGSCFPKDVAALKSMADGAGLHPQLLRAVTEINDDQRRWVVDELDTELDGLEHRTIALFGYAFKPDTDDLRQSPAVDIAQRLVARGASIRAYDPVAAPNSCIDAVVCSSAVEAATGAHAVLVATEWQEFVDIDWSSVAAVMLGTLVFDGRNCLRPEAVTVAGLEYRGVGRNAVHLPTRESVLA